MIDELKYAIGQQVRRFRNAYVDDYVFIHINKTGGSSVERALGLPFEHKTAAEKRAELGPAEWDRRFTFTIVRDPWDKVVSHYHYRVQTNQTGLGSRPVSFREWVLRAYRDRDPAYYDQPRMFMPQCDWVESADGTLLVDAVCRFERLADDFAGVCRRIGKPRATIPHEKPSRRGPYQAYYDDETAGVVADRFARDLARFGYRFGS